MPPESQKTRIFLIVYLSGSIYFYAPPELVEQFKKYGTIVDKLSTISAYRLIVDRTKFNFDQVISEVASELDKFQETAQNG